MSTFYTFDGLYAVPMSVCGIYRITCTANSKQYVGSSKDIKARLRFHKYNAENNNSTLPLLYDDMRLYGLEFFIIEILEECSRVDLLGRERYWIESLNTSVSGYNIRKKTDLRGKKHGERSFLIYLESYDLYGYIMHKMPQHICGIYCITSLDTGKQYIGRSIDLKVRLRLHRHDSVNHPEYSPTFYNDIHAFGVERFKVELLEECSPDDLVTRERYWINVLGTEYGGYNLSRVGLKSSELTKERVSKAFKGRANSEEHNKKISQANMGKAHSDERKKAIREAMRKQSKLSVDDVKDIKRLLRQGVKQREIIDIYHINRVMVYRIKFGLMWGDVQIDE